MDELIQAAAAARERAYAPYSHFKVGAAVCDGEGHIFTGCNIESASFGLTLCAERVAIFKAISEGCGRLVRVAVVTEADTLTTPCGACRQILWEHCPDAELILANTQGHQEIIAVRDLFPKPFDASSF